MRTLLALVLLAATAAATSQADPAPAMRAAEAIEHSIAQPHRPLAPQWIVMHVCASGTEGATGYLNSAADYRSRASLNVELPLPVRAELQRRLGADPVAFLPGRRILVYGSARQVRIDWFRGGQPTGEYYFQTQLRLHDADHLELVDTDPDTSAASCQALVS
ncbi:hypothetical protein [Maricaulis sp. CAU 1757]